MNGLVWNVHLAGVVSDNINSVAILPDVKVEVIIIKPEKGLFLKVLLQDFRGEGDRLIVCLDNTSITA